jgi:hypothetical protein
MSLIVGNCLKYIVGLSRTECSCDYYASCGDFDDSLSGLYLDELSPLNTIIIKGREDCEKGGICEIMDTARANGIKAFKSDIYGLVLRTHELGKKRFNGIIGKKQYTTTLDLSSHTYSVNRMFFKNVIGGSMTISNIWCGFDTTHDIILYIYNNLNELVDTLTLNATANTWTENSVSVELSTHSDFIDNLEYFFVYQIGVAKPFDNDVQGGLECRPLRFCNPEWQTQTNQQFGFWNWLNYYGSTKNDLDFMDWDVTGTDNMNGLIFDVDIKCDVDEVLCRNNIDFDSSPVALPIAEAIRYRSGMELIDLLLSSPELNRETLINRDLLIEYRKEFLSEYKRIMYYDKDDQTTGAIERGLIVTDSDCFKCKDNWGMNKIGILS